MTQSFPEPFEVLPSGMPRPKKSLLAVVGLTARTGRAIASARMVPCQSCAFSPCPYRRAPYRHGAASVSEWPLAQARSHLESPTRPPLTRDAKYTVNPRALRKWAQERVRIDYREDGSIDACFRFDGTTCSNLGRPLAFDYTVALSAPADGCTIIRADCRPAPGDEGHTHMCAYLSDATTLMNAIGTEKPLLGRPLNDILGWARTPALSGCYCTADSRVHKWGLALEAIHFALAHTGARVVPESVSNFP